MKTHILVDGNNLFYRSYHALRDSNLTTENGKPIFAVHGFLMALFKYAVEYNSLNLIVLFDGYGGNDKRKMIYPQYKENRIEVSEEIRDQKIILQTILKDLNVPFLVGREDEADDMIGTLAVKFSKKNENVLILSSDRDFYQLLSSKVKINNFKEEFSENDFSKKYDLSPVNYIKVASLRGEVSDNIKGVRGIGEKNAIYIAKKIVDISDIDEIKNSSELSARQKDLLLSNQDIIKINLKLCKLNLDARIDIDYNLARINLITGSKEIFFNHNLEKCYLAYQKLLNL